jgi:hypothetical protein
MPTKASQFQTPILFVVFNRPDTTQRVFDEIKKVRPTKLYIAADGPRPNKQNDIDGCAQVREIFSKQIDWPCEVKTLFREKNLGCKYAVASAFDWFFENVEEGIILEDDDLPDPTFFPFCQEMLAKYRNDTRVMHISGCNFQQKNKKFRPEGSYYFAFIPHIWGWASWRRAWKHYDVEVTKWPEMKERGLLKNLFHDKAVSFMWANSFQRYHDKKINSYDGQWAFACLDNGGLCINPSKNLISNIGFGANSTHTSDATNENANLPTEPLEFPLKHPSKIEVDWVAEKHSFKHHFHINLHFSQKIKWFLKYHLTTPYVFTKKLFYKAFLRKKIYNDIDLMSYIK